MNALSRNCFSSFNTTLSRNASPSLATALPAQHIHGAGNVQRTTLITVDAPTLLSWQ